MDEEVEDEEYGEVFTVEAHRISIWPVIGAFFELIENVHLAFAGFWSSLTLVCVSAFNHRETQTAMHDQATAEIEMLIKES